MSQVGGEVEVTSVRVSTTSGRIRVIAEDRRDVEVQGKARVVTLDDQMTIESTSGSVVVHVPTGCDIVAGTASARVALEGSLGAVAVVSTSGRVSVESAKSADLRTASARIEVGTVAGELRAHTTSGRVTSRASGRAEVSTASGRIQLAGVSGPVHAHCTSGRIEIELVEPHDIDAETVSGRVSVSLPPGTLAHRPSEPSEPRPAECDCTVIARSVSGRVTVS